MAEPTLANVPDRIQLPPISSLTDDEARILLGYMWNERRGRPILVGKPNMSLIIALSKPTYDTREITTAITTLLRETPPELAYDWSRQWGRTRIVLSTTDTNSISFLDTTTEEAKKYYPVTSSAKVRPSFSMYDENPVNGGFILLLNDRMPLTIEAAVLQIERLTDELVWATTRDYEKKLNIPGPAAYTAAVEFVRSKGLNVRYGSLEDILLYKRDHPKAITRIYGDVEGRQVIPSVIGIVLPPSEGGFGTILEHRAYSPNIAESHPLSFGESSSGSERHGPVALAGFTIGKRLHVGHLFHLGRLDSTSATFRGSAVIHLEFNDTGRRFYELLRIGSAETGHTTDELSLAISRGEVAFTTIERWYRSRETTTDTHAYDSFPTNGLSMVPQAEYTMETLKKLFPSHDLSYCLSSQLEHSVILEHSDPPWRQSGFETFDRRILRREGVPTPLLSRASFALSALQLYGCGRPYFYVDSSLEVSEALHIVNVVSKESFLAQKGAAVGFNFEIASGTKGDAESLDDLLAWFTASISADAVDLIKDVAYLTGSRSMVVPLDGRDAFYNYKDPVSLREDVGRAHGERRGLLAVLDNIEQVIPVGSQVIFAETINKAERQELRKIIATKLDQSLGFLEEGRVLTVERAISETMQVRQAAGSSGWAGTLRLLQNEISNGNTPKSNIVAELAIQGYREPEEQVWALRKLEETGVQLRFRFTPQHLVLRSMLAILEGVRTLDSESHNKFVNACRLLMQRL